MPLLCVNPFEFLDEHSIPKTRFLGLSIYEDFLIIACVVLTQCQRVTNRWTDGRTDRQTVANTALCRASYADALYKIAAFCKQGWHTVRPSVCLSVCL